MTVQQQQNLLAYLGYYCGRIDGLSGTATRDAVLAFQRGFGGIAADGICGSQTEKALRHAVAYGMPERREADFWQDIRYFAKGEFACKCGRYCDGYPANMAESVVRAADALRTHFAVPVTVSSGLRCPTHNANVGGVTNSRHLTGKAVDLSAAGIPAAELLAYAETLPQIRYAYAIDESYIHMDVV